jgi:EAL domain-containing protein (putative c-di-GMP-specific phosphodiesterase class I)
MSIVSSRQLQSFIVSVQFLKPRRWWWRKLCTRRWLVLESTEQRALLALDLDRSILPSLRAAGCEIINWVVEPAVANHNQRVIIEL